jgi:hypothetical protein
VLAFNGDLTNPGWQYVDGNTTTGLNVDSDYDAALPAGIGHDGRIVILWTEDYGGGPSIRNLRAIEGR